MNEESEHGVITRFFEHIQELAPNVIVTYNGDFFDFPFLSARAEVNGKSRDTWNSCPQNAFSGLVDFHLLQRLHSAQTCLTVKYFVI